MTETVNGSGGIPRNGREKEYATEMWLDDPSAFFLHPEGPLSDTTPEEWLAKQPKPPEPPPWTNAFANASYQAQLMQAQYNPSDLLNGTPGAPIRYNPNYYPRQSRGLLGDLLGF